MSLTNRAVSILVWADSIGLHGKFGPEDEFVTMTGDLVKLGEAEPDSVVWLPKIESLKQVIYVIFDAGLEEKVVDGIILLSATCQGKLIEGAGKDETDAVISFIEGLRDARNQRSLSTD